VQTIAHIYFLYVNITLY